MTRETLLERYGRIYGNLGLAVAFTRTNSGDDAKRCGPGWDKTKPLTDPEFAAGLLAERGKKRNPAIVLRPSNLIGVECDTPERLEQFLALNPPATVTVQSSAPHKLHFWYRPPSETSSYCAFRFEEHGITADSGRYLLCPPAVHPSGSVYEFLRSPEDTQIAALPQDAYDELVRLSNAATANGSEPRLSATPSRKEPATQR